MKPRTLWALAGIAVLCPAFALGEEPPKRPDWDQKKAVETVKCLIALDATGQPWDKIEWLTNGDKAVTRAKQENKPIFVYFFLKKNLGPVHTENVKMAAIRVNSSAPRRTGSWQQPYLGLPSATPTKPSRRFQA